jgi:adenylate cyclase, class 2
MAVEAELKARLEHPDRVRGALAALADVERADYADTYYDDDGRSLEAGQRELRIRTTTVAGRRRHILTYKDAPVHADSGSKPEHETDVTQPRAVDALLTALGYQPVIAFTKHCENYTFEYDGLTVLSTVVTVPELDGTFLEVETMADERDVGSALETLRDLLEELGVPGSALTTEVYTQAVGRRRRTR